MSDAWCVYLVPLEKTGSTVGRTLGGTISAWLGSALTLFIGLLDAENIELTNGIWALSSSDLWF